MKQSLDMDEFPCKLTHCNGLYVGHWQESIEGLKLSGRLHRQAICGRTITKQ